MKVHVFGAVHVMEDMEPARPELRKATKNMRLCVSALERILAGWTIAERKGMGLVLSSTLGELEVTKDFLSTLALSGVARPFLFQNSLHNATTGFLSLQFQIHGPSCTLSDYGQSAAQSLDIAISWLETGLANTVAAVAVDTDVAGLPHVGVASAGAFAAVLSSLEPTNNRPSLGTLNSQSFNSTDNDLYKLVSSFK